MPALALAIYRTGFRKTPEKPAKETPVHNLDGFGDGKQVKDVIPDDEESVGRNLFEEGMAGPAVALLADDQRRK